MDVLWDGPTNASVLFILTHGAGAPMDSALLTRVTAGLVERGHRVARFEFPYMAARRTGGGRGPPDRTAVLLQAWRDAVAQCRLDARPLFLGGHSMGGRMATMVADELRPQGVTSLAYPWHPPEAPHKTRTEHLATLQTPTLLVCGTRDVFGTPQEVAGYTLSSNIQVHWLDGADHSFAAKARSGRTAKDNIVDAVNAMDVFASTILRGG